jgi:imidazolonepropionase-like amidohydrolase
MKGWRAFWEGPKGKALRSNVRNNFKLMHQAGIPLAMGTDAGNPGTAHGPSIYNEM